MATSTAQFMGSGAMRPRPRAPPTPMSCLPSFSERWCNVKRLLLILAAVSLAVLSLGATVGHAQSPTAGPLDAGPVGRDLVLSRTLTEATTGPFAGDTLELFGAGSFNLRAMTADARGTFIHRHSDGSLVEAGIWIARRVVSFESFGTTPEGLLEGGVAVLVVDAYDHEGNFVVRSDDVTITCLFGNPPPDAEEGVTIASLGFTEPIETPHRFTLFERI